MTTTHSTASVSLPVTGDVVAFTVAPVASYVTVGEAYRVEREGQYFRFVSVKRGVATFDKAWAVARSTWAHVAA